MSARKPLPATARGDRAASAELARRSTSTKNAPLLTTLVVQGDEVMPAEPRAVHPRVCELATNSRLPYLGRYAWGLRNLQRSRPDSNL